MAPEKTVRAKIAAGALPLPKDPPGQIWVGYGSGQSCDGCDEPITAAQLEYEVDIPGRTLRFHSKCLAAWHEARNRRPTD